ncbi:RHS repeat-associated core domain-containing protein [Actinomycetospora soli]|uniref:RHS repeat-associated core domain-containing protein n=1 Tax=Actinomycetospora soli TaxID=2893887 RepID=UPI001E288197|nr:RHS repeat-associated core domain-containing protein [Actinomycetospora soli]MCD2190987.1 hypothetical protein [Actinomycetospora soli]
MSRPPTTTTPSGGAGSREPAPPGPVRAAQCQGALSHRLFSRNTFWRAGLVVGLSTAVLAGVAVEPPRAEAAPLLPTQTDPSPGAPGYKPGPAGIFAPLAAINRIVTGGASPSTWGRDSSQGLPTDVPTDPSAQAPKPGLGTKDFYPLERRALGDRMELLVNLANGNVIVRNKDLAFAGTGLNTAVNHDYNNLATNRGSFGKRWTMTTGRDVGLDVSDPNKIKLQGPSGYREDYDADGNGGFKSPSGANAKLTKTDTGYRLEFDKTKEKWNFDNNGFFTTQVDRNDNTITYNYNGNGTLASIKDTRGAVTTFDYDAAGRVTKMTDPTGYEYSGYTYDLQGQHTGFTDPSGKRVRYEYDQAGNLTSITDPNGNEYRLTYDADRRVTKVDEPRETGVLTNDRAVTNYEYVSATETKETNPAGGVTTYTFDSDGRQTKAKDPLGREESKTYTANSDVNTTTSVGGNVSTASFDPNNRLIGTQLPTGARNTVGYTDAANPFGPTSMTDSEGRQTTMTYDAKGNPLTVKSVANSVGIERQYNDNGTVKESKDGRGIITRYDYDPDGRLITVTPPGPRQPIRYGYDSRSRITSVTDGNGVVIEYAYDAADRVVQQSQRDGTTRRVIQQTDFDANGNKTSNYFAGVTKQFTYNPRNQVLTDVRRGGALAPTDSVTYTYDAVNNLSSLTDAGGKTSYKYNTANDLTELTDLAGGKTTYDYDRDGNQKTTTYPNTISMVREYDKSGRETKRTSYAAGETPSVRTYNYGGANGGDTELLQSMGEPNNSTTRYSYDGASRLTRALNRSNSNGATITDYQYTYDRASNINGMQGRSQTWSSGNLLTAIGSLQVRSDAQGNQTGDNNGGSTSYTPTNQQNVRVDPGLAFQAQYDTSDSTQLYKIDDVVRSNGARFSYEFTNTALGMTGRIRAGQGRYSISRDPDGNPVMQRDPNGSLHYFELDRQGSIMGTTGTNRARTSAFHYQPYGAYDYAAGSHSSNADNFLGFQGGFFHSNAGYTKFGHRWYNAGAGIFTQPDPIGTPGSSGSGQDNRSGIGGPYSTELNAFGFAEGSPCNNSDPSGLFSITGSEYGDCILRGTAQFASLGAISGLVGGGAASAPLFLLGAATGALIAQRDCRRTPTSFS